MIGDCKHANDNKITRTEVKLFDYANEIGLMICIGDRRLVFSIDEQMAMKLSKQLLWAVKEHQDRPR